MTASTDLIEMLRDARRRSLGLIGDLTDDEIMGPELEIVNPLRWEIGHVAWFQEHWTLRNLYGLPSLRTDSDSLYDSAKVGHFRRWHLPLPTRDETISYGDGVLDAVAARLDGRHVDERTAYFHRLALLHEDMHGEAFTYTRQTLAYAPPPLFGEPLIDGGGPLEGDVHLDGGRFLLGASPEEKFVFDNEKWAHPVDVAPFRIARAAVSNARFAEFVDDRGYDHPALWTDEGWSWRSGATARTPAYWKRDDGGRWLLRRWNEWIPLPPYEAVIHVNAHEAEAWCRWAGRRLPSEAEWEFAASVNSDGTKRRYPWGDDAPRPDHGNLDARNGWVTDVGAFRRGDTPTGIRQLFGNVWEWTSTRFLPYPGFVEDPYREYSAPWFAYPHRVLRGGAWPTRSRLLRNTWRNFYEPHRRDVFAGFRTCAAGDSW